MQKNRLKKALNLLQEGDLRAIVKKTENRKKIRQQDEAYDRRQKQRLADLPEQERQRKAAAAFAYRPLISVVIPVWKTPPEMLRALLDSLAAQTYPHFEVCVADATPDATISGDAVQMAQLPEEVLREYQIRDDRFRYVHLAENLGISDNTNAAIRMAQGEFVAFADHDDLLTADALYACVKMLQTHPDVQILYSDEDKTDAEGARFFAPHFKSDYNPDFLCTCNYFSHLTVIRRSLLETVAEKENGRVVYERRAYDGAQDYDLVLRCVEHIKDPAQILHIPRVLYHWRVSETSTAGGAEAKTYAIEAGARAVADHLNRIGERLLRVENGIAAGWYRPVYACEPANISVILFGDARTEELEKSLQALEHSVVRTMEILVVSGGKNQEQGKNKKTDNFRRLLTQKHPNVRVIETKQTDSIAAACNAAAAASSGPYLLFLRAGMEPDRESIREMLSMTQRPSVGACGAKITDDRKNILEAGMFRDQDGHIQRAFAGTYDADLSYMHLADSIRDCVCVSADCLLTERDIYEQVGGFPEGKASSAVFCGAEYCRKVRGLGKRIVYTPYAACIAPASVEKEAFAFT